MSSRHVILGIFQEAYLRGRQGAIDDSALLGLPPVDLQSIVMSTAIQAGARTVELTSRTEHATEVRGWLRQHVKFYDGPEWAHLYSVISSALKEAALDPSLDPGLRLHDVFVFLLDLLYALQRGKDVVTVYGLPEVASFEPFLRPEATVALRNLLASFETVEPDVVIPRRAVQPEDVVRFAEILISPLYREYEDHHEDLACGTGDNISRTKGLRFAAKELCTRNASLLRRAKIMAALMPVSTKLIDSGFGALPGRLAEVAVDLISRWLRMNRRLVIYDLRSTLDLVSHARMQNYLARAKRLG